MRCVRLRNGVHCRRDGHFRYNLDNSRLNCIDFTSETRKIDLVYFSYREMSTTHLAKNFLLTSSGDGLRPLAGSTSSQLGFRSSLPGPAYSPSMPSVSAAIERDPGRGRRDFGISNRSYGSYAWCREMSGTRRTDRTVRFQY